MNAAICKDETLLRLPDVMRISGLRRSQLYSLIKKGRFVTPVKLSERCVAFPESLVRAWVSDRIAASQVRP